MARPLKIVVSGYLVGFPMGGMAWMLGHWLLGLQRLGHELFFLEDAGDWTYPFNPLVRDFGTDSGYGRQVLGRFFAHLGLDIPWAYRSGLEQRTFGASQDEIDAWCESCDVFLNISGIIPLRESYMKARCKVLIDTDPVWTMVKGAQAPADYAYYLAHDAHFTFGCNLPAGDTPVPLLDIAWKPMLPPVVLDQWSPLDTPGRRYATIGSWDTRDREVCLAGETYSWRKSLEYEKIFDLPRKVPPGVEFELSYSNMRPEEVREYEAHGWIISDALDTSRDYLAYRDMILGSRGEFTVAKDLNIRLRSGWFSDRAVCYLAAGRPVLTQDTGFDAYLPVGEGLFSWRTEEDILAAAEAVEADYPRHRAAALRIAREHFDSDRVLTGMLKDIGLA
ncbi:MAG: hypothetical protein AB1916_06130 [Thermodesulfobacteriota bacterium]